VVEVLGHIVAARHHDPRIVGLALRLTDGNGQASLLLGEQVGADLVVVVQAQQLATLGHEVVDTVTWAPSPGPSAGPGGRRSGQLELPADGGLQFDVVADELEPQHGGPVQPDVRAAGLPAALAPVVAAVELATLAVLVEGHEPMAQPATDPAREEVGTSGPAPHAAPMGSGEGLRRDDRFVVPGKPLAVHLDLTEINPRPQNAQHG